MCNYSGYTQHLGYTSLWQPAETYMMYSKLPKMLLSPVAIDGKTTPHMENHTHIRKMQLIASLTVLVEVNPHFSNSSSKVFHFLQITGIYILEFGNNLDT